MAILKLKNKTTGEWEEIQAIKGEQGPQGPQGVQGPKGDKGDSGASEWGDIGGTLSNQTDLQNALDSKADASNIPTKTSDLTNDSGFITSSSLPTKVSDLTNDSGFITNTVNNLTNYYTKTNTYTKSEVDSLISSISSLDIQIVQTLPTRDISTSTIYLVPKTASTNDNYDEYIYVNNSWEHIGSTEVDLSNYYTKTQTDNLLDDKADVSSLSTVATTGSYNDLSNKPTIPTVNNATLTIQKNGTTVKTFTANASSNVTANITVPTKTSDLTNDSGFVDNTYHDSSKQDTLVSGTNIKTINNESILGVGDISITGKLPSITTTTNIWELNQGVYDVGPSVNLYYKSDGYVTTSSYGAFLFVGHKSSNRRPFYLMGRDPLTSSNNYNYIYIGVAQNNVYGIIDSYNLEGISSAVTLYDNQTIYGVKNFSTLPKSTVVPTDDAHLVNKKYVDDSITSAIGTALGGSY